MEIYSIIESIQTGMGNTLEFLVLILGLGAMLGKLVADSGAAQRITSKLVAGFGIQTYSVGSCYCRVLCGYSHVLFRGIC
ncbi:MAG: hypothetical protein R3B93_28140 [Bacteroidia bacterium]